MINIQKLRIEAAAKAIADRYNSDKWIEFIHCATNALEAADEVTNQKQDCTELDAAILYVGDILKAREGNPGREFYISYEFFAVLEAAKAYRSTLSNINDPKELPKYVSGPYNIDKLAPYDCEIHRMKGITHYGCPDCYLNKPPAEPEKPTQKTIFRSSCGCHVYDGGNRYCGFNNKKHREFFDSLIAANETNSTPICDPKIIAAKDEEIKIERIFHNLWRTKCNEFSMQIYGQNLEILRLRQALENIRYYLSGELHNKIPMNLENLLYLIDVSLPVIEIKNDQTTQAKGDA